MPIVLEEQVNNSYSRIAPTTTHEEWSTRTLYSVQRSWSPCLNWQTTHSLYTTFVFHHNGFAISGEISVHYLWWQEINNSYIEAVIHRTEIVLRNKLLFSCLWGLFCYFIHYLRFFRCFEKSHRMSSRQPKLYLSVPHQSHLWSVIYSLMIAMESERWINIVCEMTLSAPVNHITTLTWGFKNFRVYLGILQSSRAVHANPKQGPYEI